MQHAPIPLRISAHPLVEVIASKLYRRVWHDAYTVCAIPSHETSPTFIPPHLRKTFPHRQFVFVPPNALYLERIFRRSKGDTTVLDTAPATPPARKAAKTGCDTVCRSCMRRDNGAGTLSPSVPGTDEGDFRFKLIVAV